MAPEPTTDQQFELVYDGIVAVAARCDGAQSLDMKGFDGTDTHFGRRIASVPFAQWTQEVKEEAARISNKYREQILRYTGTDVSTLPVVKDLLGKGTIYKARNDARAYEKRAKHLAARVIDAAKNDRGQPVLGIRWANGDPDFSIFLKLVQALPGRRWNPSAKVNEVPASPEVRVFIDEHDFTLTPAAEALLVAAEAPQAPAPAPETAAQAKADIWLAEQGNRVVIQVPYNPLLVEDLQQLPGRSYDRPKKLNTANANPAVLALATKWNLVVAPAAREACEAAQRALETASADDLDAEDLSTVLTVVSRTGSPGELPPVFVALLNEILP